jgi:hypothetical protein
MGRSSVFVIGTLCPITGALRITVTASTVRPVALEFDYYPDSAELATALDENVRSDLYFDDPHGTVEHRRHLTYYYAEEIRNELQVVDERLEQKKAKVWNSRVEIGSVENGTRVAR